MVYRIISLDILPPTNEIFTFTFLYEERNDGVQNPRDGLDIRSCLVIFSTRILFQSMYDEVISFHRIDATRRSIFDSTCTLSTDERKT